jgi:hypothetical protein
MKTCVLWLAALCIAPACDAAKRYYLDPSYGTARYEDLSRPEQPLLLKLSVTPTPHGEPQVWYPKEYREWEGYLREFFSERRAHAAHVLRKSGLIRSSYLGEDGSITLTLESDEERSSCQVVTPGWFNPGSVCRFVHTLEVVISTGDRQSTRQYEHAFLAYLSGAPDPQGLTLLGGEDEAHNAVMEQMLLRALRDFQSEGIIPTGHVTQAGVAPHPAPWWLENARIGRSGRPSGIQHR